MLEDHFEANVKLFKFWLMLYNLFIVFGSGFTLYRIYIEGEVAWTGNQQGLNIYQDPQTRVRRVFCLIELGPLLELLHHFIGFQKMRQHNIRLLANKQRRDNSHIRFIFIHMIVNIWIIFGVIDFFPGHKYVIFYIILRCFEKIIRHFYNAYLAMDLKFEVYYIDYFRMTSFYVFCLLEYIFTVLLVLVTLPHINKQTTFSLWMPNFLNFNFDYKFVFFFYLCVSVPNFINTYIYLHRKRIEQIQYARSHNKKYD